MADRAKTSRKVILAVVAGLLVGRPAAARAQPGDAAALSGQFRQAARSALPGVVTVRPLGVGSPLDGIGVGRDDAARPGRDGGAGFVVDAARGLVATNDHVIAPATRGVVVILGNGRERPVRQVFRDPRSDLALLAIDPTDLAALPWGDDSALDIGDWVLAIGGPFGLSGTVTAGIVSGKGRGLGIAHYEDLIQTDAAINPGNSGGPLINLRGEVVGINTALKSSGGGFEGVGFAIPAGRARRVVAELADSGRVRRAYIGITIRPADPATLARLNRAEASAVGSVTVGGPAGSAGVQPGDIILAAAGRAVGNSASLQAAIEVAPIAEPLELTIDRRGQVFPVVIRPTAQPEGFGVGAVVGPGSVPVAAVGSGGPPGEVVVPIRRRGLHIDVPGANMVVPGPNLDITPFGVSRPHVLVPEPVLIPPEPAAPGIPGDLNPVSTAPPEPEPRPDGPARIEPKAPVETAERSAQFAGLGLTLTDPSPLLADRSRLDRGTTGLVVTAVEPDGPADRAGLEPGMLVTDAAGRLVGSVDDFRRAAANPAGGDLVVRIRRGRKVEYRILVGSTLPPPPVELAPLPPPATSSRPL